MDGAQNVVLIGGPGTGKTHVATALGIQAIEHHRRKVRFFSTNDHGIARPPHPPLPHLGDRKR
jgi:DNA replication protein DnaC